LVDRGALGNGPAAAIALILALHAVEEARARGEIDIDAVEFLAHPDDDAGLGRGAVAVELDRRREQVMTRPAGAVIGAATLNELLERAAEPRYRNMAVGREGCAQLLPLALVAVDAPGLHQFGAGELVG